MTVSSKTPLLDQIKTPEDLRRLEPAQLQQVAEELRHETIDAVAVRYTRQREDREEPAAGTAYQPALEMRAASQRCS